MTLKRPIQARLQAWEFTKKLVLTERDNSLELKQLLAVFARGKKKLSLSLGCCIDRLKDSGFEIIRLF